MRDPHAILDAVLTRADDATGTPQLVAALKAVLARHTAEYVEGRWLCRHCFGWDSTPVLYPCPTVEDISTALEVIQMNQDNTTGIMTQPVSEEQQHCYCRNGDTVTNPEPSDEMVLAALNTERREQYRSWGRINPETGEVQWEDRDGLDEFAEGVVKKARVALTAALAMTPNKDDRPWEPLNGRVVRVGNEVRQDYGGVTITGVVAHVYENGDLFTESTFIGKLDVGTWYIRRPAQELPPEHDGAVLVPADGLKVIAMKGGQKFSRLTFSADQSVWYGPRVNPEAGEPAITRAWTNSLTPGTWMVEEK